MDIAQLGRLGTPHENVRQFVSANEADIKNMCALGWTTNLYSVCSTGPHGNFRISFASVVMKCPSVAAGRVSDKRAVNKQKRDAAKNASPPRSRSQQLRQRGGANG